MHGSPVWRWLISMVCAVERRVVDIACLMVVDDDDPPDD